MTALVQAKGLLVRDNASGYFLNDVFCYPSIAWKVSGFFCKKARKKSVLSHIVWFDYQRRSSPENRILPGHPGGISGFQAR